MKSKDSSLNTTPAKKRRVIKVSTKDYTSNDKVYDLDIASKTLSCIPFQESLMNAVQLVSENNKQLIKAIQDIQLSRTTELAETVIKSLDIHRSSFAELSKVASNAQSISLAYTKLAIPEIMELNIAKATFLQINDAGFTQNIAKIVEQMKPLFDLRIAVNTAFTLNVKQIHEIVNNSVFDFSTILKSIPTDTTHRFEFIEPTLSFNKSDITLEAVATRTSSNEFVVQEQTTKVDLIVSANVRQTEILERLDMRVGSIENTIQHLLSEGQQLITVRDIKYDPTAFILNIKGKAVRTIKASRERQLCQLLLTSVKSMSKKWELDELLDAIGEGFSVEPSEYKNWTQKYYMAARRLNEKLIGILGYELIIVDGKSEQIFVNPQFYHK
jgi:hypothetical protein